MPTRSLGKPRRCDASLRRAAPRRPGPLRPARLCPPPGTPSAPLCSPPRCSALLRAAPRRTGLSRTGPAAPLRFKPVLSRFSPRSEHAAHTWELEAKTCPVSPQVQVYSELELPPSFFIFFFFLRPLSQAVNKAHLHVFAESCCRTRIETGLT